MPETRQVKVEPTKELFVYILTRDIAHQAAIIELIDNSIDGALRVAPRSDCLSHFAVDIDFDATTFRIRDNCGGIPLDVAINYAFRFGRAPGMQAVPKSIGQFGVGMKRALFSFGRSYVVDSATDSDWFRLKVNLDNWIKKPTWDFELTDYGCNDGSKPVGTTIEIRDLNDAAASVFELSSFSTRVENEIRQKHGLFITRGLTVKLNGMSIPGHDWQLIMDEQFSPEYIERTYDGASVPLMARIYAGLGRSSPIDAGWYVICNGRLVLGADKSDKTGWGWPPEQMDAATGTPRYHNQFARFRGYVLFDSDDAGRLPWNTTKTDVDVDDPIWRDARERMSMVMRPVINFLNMVDNESELAESERPLTAALSLAKERSIADLRSAQHFRYPSPKKPSRPRTVSVQYRKEKERVDALSEAMGTASARSTGEAAFDEAYKKYVEE